MAFFSIRRRLQSVMALADAVRKDWPAMESLPTKSPSLDMSRIVSLPAWDLTASFTFPFE
jgi:hypothetical protein